MKAGCLLSAVLLLSGLSPTGAQETEDKPIRVCICGFTVEGLGPEIISAAITAIVEELKTMGVEVSPAPEPEPVLAAECFEDPACLRESGENLEIDGMLDVSILRSGPMVRINFRLFASATGAKVHETGTVAPYEDFPGTTPIARNLEPVLKTIRDIKPEEKKPPPPPPPPEPKVAEKIEPKIEPKPDPDPAAERSGAAPVGVPGPVPEIRVSAPAKPDPYRTWGWVAVGVGGAILAGAGVTGVIALDLDGDLSTRCDASHRCADSQQGDIDRLDTLTLTTDVLLGVGAAAVITGTLLLTVFAGDDADIQVQPSAGPGGVGAAITGRF